jgi:high-affinity Fe2+/Pb2+ permease
MATAAAALAAIGFVTFKFGVRLPIGPFFAAPSALPSFVAVVFTGHGVAAAAASPRWVRAESAREEPTWLSLN